MLIIRLHCTVVIAETFCSSPEVSETSNVTTPGNLELIYPSHYRMGS